MNGQVLSHRRLLADVKGLVLLAMFVSTEVRISHQRDEAHRAPHADGQRRPAKKANPLEHLVLVQHLLGEDERRHDPWGKKRPQSDGSTETRDSLRLHGQSPRM